MSCAVTAEGKTPTVPVITSPAELIHNDVYIDCRELTQTPLYLKCEGFNFAGSIKLKAAAEMVAAARRDGRLTPDSVLVESSSGNLGVALSVIAAQERIPFLCVIDGKCNAATRRLMTALGARVHVVTRPTPDGGLLGARIAYIEELCARDSRYVWTNQYANEANWRAHYRYTAPMITQRFPDARALFIGAGTAGTLMGCARYLREIGSHTRVVAVDVAGSVSFGGPAGPRHIPGLGMAVAPPLLDPSYLDGVVRVDELETVRMCRRFARGGYVIGGSTGTVVRGAQQWLAENGAGGVAVAISPDLGERYLDTIYDDEWTRERYGSLDRSRSESIPLTMRIGGVR